MEIFFDTCANCHKANVDISAKMEQKTLMVKSILMLSLLASADPTYIQPNYINSPATNPIAVPDPTYKGKPAAAKASGKAQYNTQVFEKENAEETFAGVVKILREVQGDTQVFFEGKSGAYSLDSASPKFGAYQSLLVASQKNKSEVAVTATDGRVILTVNRP